MISLIIAGLIVQGPTQKGQRPSDSLRQHQGERLDLDFELADGSAWESVLSQNLELTVNRNASLMAPINISWRGSRTQHIQWTLDGLPLGDALGGGSGLRSLDPHLFGRLTAFASTGSGLDAPIGGELALKTRRTGHRLKLISDHLFQTGLHLNTRNAKRSLSLSTSQTPGQFTYFDHRGTLWIEEDDQWITRTNNDARRTGILWREQLSSRLVGRFLLSTVNGGIPGTGSRPLNHVREREDMQLAHGSWQSTKGTDRIDLSILQRQQQLDDPQAEFSGLFGLQPRSVGRRIFLGWRHKKLGKKYAYELQVRGLIDTLTRQPGPTLNSATGVRFKGQIGSTFRTQLNDQLSLESWAMLGEVSDETQPLIDQLPEALKPDSTSPRNWIWAPGLSLNYNEKFRLRLLSGQRAPSLFERVGQHGGLKGNPELKAERSWTIDGSYHHRANHHRLQIHTYARQSSNLIDWTATSFGRAMPINRSLAHIAGFRISGSIHYAQIQSIIDYRWQGEWVQDSSLDEQFKRLASSPEHHGRWITYWTKQPWRFGFGVSAKSHMYLDAANLRLIASKPESNLIAERRINPYARLSIQCFNLTNNQQTQMTLLPSKHRIDVPHQDRWGHPLPGRRIQIGFTLRESP